MKTVWMRAALPALAALALAAGPAAAQQDVPDAGGRVYGLVGGGFGGGRFVATGAGAGLRLTRHVGLDVELTHLTRGGRGGHAETAPFFSDAASVFGAASLAGATPEDYPPAGIDDDYLFPLVSFQDEGRDVTTFLTKFTVEFPIADGRLYPYLTGGGGVGRVTERYRISVTLPDIPWGEGPLPIADASEPVGGRGLPFGDPAELSFGPTDHSELGLALVLGGGVDVRLWRGLGVGIDLRWLRILRSADALDTAQATARASYRF